MIKAIQFVELYVGNAVQAVHYFESALGFRVVGVCEDKSHNKISYHLRQNSINLIITSGMTQCQINLPMS